ncbi:MAG: alanine racemase [Acidimicrobiales bacterium]|nr:alanine racemase [Acidimicrobiales bacterium]
MHRPAWAEVDLGAIRANASALAAVASPARLCAVVKADGYGHGAVPVATAALEGGADGLAVALVSEGVALREGDIDAPVLVLSEPPAAEIPVAVAAGLALTLYTEAGIEVAAASGAHGVQLKVDTGMHRVGADPADAVALAKAALAAGLELDAVWTHLAIADEPDDPYTAQQLARFDGVLSEMAAAGIHPGMVHAANSAGAIAHPDARRDMVRCGIALYGLDPSPQLAGACDLHPAMSLQAHVSHVRRLAAGERLSYGLRYRLDRPATIATVPIGYADGVPRRLSAVGGEVLVGGRRRPIAGTVTMDQLMVDCGDDHVGRGDEVVLIGRQGEETITAWEWAERLGTIAYEIVCGIGPRVPRTYHS